MAEPSGTRPARRVLGVLLAAVLVGFTAQQLLTPILAPLSRELRLTEVQLGVVVTVAAVVFTLGSLVWGRVVDRWGSRRVLLTGLGIAVVGMAGFGLSARLALDSGWGTPATLTALLATRSVLFGTGIGAVPVAALAYVSAATEGEKERTRAVSLVGAAQAISLILGPGIGGALAVADLLAPVYLAPVLLVAILVAVLVLVPGLDRTAPTDDTAGRVGPLDPRVRPFLLVGFLLFLSLGVMQVVLGFLVQDRLELDAGATAASVGTAMVITGLVLVAMQAAVVPRLGWSPARLIRTGAPIAAAGFAVLALAGQLWLITVGLCVVAVGLGMAMPGYSAGATLRVQRSEQGAVAGLLNATTGATFIVGPLLGTALYPLGAAVPIWVSAGCCAVGAVVAVSGRALSTPGRASSPLEGEIAG
ncbi:MFS transporter [Pseudonocardia ailaonensis]|uniref:MFS transporter n=1 Tax=Pseudonocardia ailaonensis TaxID=367279 RepID=A0ABN2MJD6_9PSEU